MIEMIFVSISLDKYGKCVHPLTCADTYNIASYC